METNTLFWGLSYNEWTLISSVVTAATAIISVVISVVTLRKNNKMIEETTRPSLQIFFVPDSTMGCIVIKNYGATSAVIDYITCSHHFTVEQVFVEKLTGNPFSILNGSTICSNHSLSFPVNVDELPNKFIEFEVKYHSPTKWYRDKFKVHPINHSAYPTVNPGKGDDVESNLHNIVKELRNINRRY